MIKVDVRRDQEGYIHTLTIKGHADAGPHGYDLICAGVSAVSFGSLNAIQSLTGLELDIKQGDRGGFLRCDVPLNIDTECQEKVQLLLEGMIVSLRTIEASYGEHIQIEDHGR
ncbi:ribosomal-processing cysteine protease Prp [Scopulibacillus cellulosilyticus]|uniref:Ribosomal processing cysteine protease Prp n=1 Tax=Scopulibacillus cellulosilyticus TaxID=2665665 RepID=A0ABW2PV17_9BACL